MHRENRCYLSIPTIISSQSRSAPIIFNPRNHRRCWGWTQRHKRSLNYMFRITFRDFVFLHTPHAAFPVDIRATYRQSYLRGIVAGVYQACVLPRILDRWYGEAMSSPEASRWTSSRPSTIHAKVELISSTLHVQKRLISTSVHHQGSYRPFTTRLYWNKVHKMHSNFQLGLLSCSTRQIDPRMKRSAASGNPRRDFSTK